MKGTNSFAKNSVQASNGIHKESQPFIPKKARKEEKQPSKSSNFKEFLASIELVQDHSMSQLLNVAKVSKKLNILGRNLRIKLLK